MAAYPAHYWIEFVRVWQTRVGKGTYSQALVGAGPEWKKPEVRKAWIEEGRFIPDPSAPVVVRVKEVPSAPAAESQTQTPGPPPPHPLAPVLPSHPQSPPVSIPEKKKEALRKDQNYYKMKCYRMKMAQLNLDNS